jgi:hypothetical protein
MHTPPARLLVALACVGLSLPLVAQPIPEDPRIDSDTGRELANYPPPRHFDFEHMRLEIDIPDMEEPAFSACRRSGCRRLVALVRRWR